MQPRLPPPRLRSLSEHDVSPPASQLSLSPANPPPQTPPNASGDVPGEDHMPAAVCAPVALPPLGSGEGGDNDTLEIPPFCSQHLLFEHLRMIYEGGLIG